MDRAKQIMPDIEYCEDAYATAKGVDAIALLTEWDVFKELDLEKIKGLMRQPVFFDGRNVFEPGKMAAMGFIYKGIGR
jgi:UDPglucose 6-dehydrogenase